MPDPVLAVRADRWLVAARIFKTRGLAQLACAGGKVKIDGLAIKPSRVVKRGETLSVESPRGPLVLVVRDLAEKRLSAPLARELYEDHSPPPPPKEERAFAVRERGAGRPTKADRRALDRLRRD
jgi:ribosome-associated heat shock protein Hsp15